MSHLAHKADAPTQLRCAVLTISDTRTFATDTGGAAVVALLEDAGHLVAVRELVADDPPRIRAFVESHASSPDIDVIISTGGTGLSGRDRTYEAVTTLFEITIEGFGELFRALSYAEIGAAAMLSRATAGIVRGTAVFLLPGSEGAVRLAMTSLIVPELRHIVRELRR